MTASCQHFCTTSTTILGPHCADCKEPLVSLLSDTSRNTPAGKILYALRQKNGKGSNVMNLQAMALIGQSVRANLRRDAADLPGTATRKGVSLNRFEEARESQVALEHFELGCWLYSFSKLGNVPRDQYLSERVDVVTRLFLAGFNNPKYDFFTVFDFGERQFDRIFEDGDAEEVIDGVRRKIPLDSSGKIAAAFGYFGWPLEKSRAPTLLVEVSQRVKPRRI